MMTSLHQAVHLRVVQPEPYQPPSPANLESLISKLEICRDTPDRLIASLPFFCSDATIGSENELQTIVTGSPDSVDLPIFIRSSNFYKNTIKYAATGDTPRYVLTALERHLSDNSGNIWENSWIRFPHRFLTSYADQVLHHDLLSDKSFPGSRPRKDVSRFFFHP